MKTTDELIGIIKEACIFEDKISNEAGNDIIEVLKNHWELLNENVDLHRKIEDAENHIKSLKCEIEHLNQRPKTRTIYKVVRSYAPNCATSLDDLDAAFYNGWQFVRASEFIPPQGKKVGYIEYILKKEIEEEE